MSDKALTAKQTRESAQKRETAKPVAQVQQADLGILQRAVADPRVARPSDILALQRTVGNRAVSRLIQTKLTVGPVGDRYEQEADHVAEQVMTMPAPTSKPSVQRAAEEEEEVQAKPLAAFITPLVQCQGAPEEEEVQTKPLVQRQGAPEEEEIQTEPLVQRQAAPEEEEVQTKSLVQRQAAPEEEEVQTKPLAASITPLVQRQGPPEGEELFQGKRVSVADGSESETIQRYSDFNRAPGRPQSDYKVMSGDNRAVMDDFGDYHIKFHNIKGLGVFDEFHIAFEAQPRGIGYFFYDDSGNVIPDKSSGLKATRKRGRRGTYIDAARAEARWFVSQTVPVPDEEVEQALKQKERGEAEAKVRQEQESRLTDKQRRERASASATKFGTGTKYVPPHLRRKPLSPPLNPLVQRQEDEEEVQTKSLVQRQAAPEEEEVQTKPLPSTALRTSVQRRADGGFDASPKIENRLSALKGGGSPLPTGVRDYMEPRFGADFSGVKVHTGPDAASMSGQIQAQAFTHGQDIYLGAGRYEPGTDAGKRLLAHELTHVVQQSGPAVQRAGGAGVRVSRSPAARVQRDILDTAQVIAGLKQIPTIRDLLEGRTSLLDKHVETRMGATDIAGGEVAATGLQEADLAAGKLRQGQTVQEHITSVLDNFHDYFQAGQGENIGNAMKLAGALNTIARVLAAKFHIPHERSKIASELLIQFRPQLQAAMMGGAANNQPMAPEAFALTAALVEKDPVGRYMQHKLSLDSAAADVIKMARNAGKTPQEMLGLLKQQYEMEMGAYNLAEVQKGERKMLKFPGGQFETEEAYGELSAKHFQEVLQLTSATSPAGAGRVQWQAGGRGLVLQAAAQTELDRLGAEIDRQETAGGVAPAVKTQRGLTAGQSSYLAGMRGREADSLAGARPKLRSFFSTHAPGGGWTPKTGLAGAWERWRTGDDVQKKADQKIDDAIKNLGRAIWVMAFKPANIFRPGAARPTEYLSAFEVPEYKKFSLGKVVSGSTAEVDRLKPSFRSRGPDYGAHRFEKDLKASGNAPLLPTELSKYGSIQVLRNPAALGELGRNDAYGNYMFVMNKKALENRSLFAIEHQQERKDPLMLMADMVDLQPSLLLGLADGQMAATQIEFHTYGHIPYDNKHIEKILLEPGIKEQDKSTWSSMTQAEQSAATEEARVKFPALTGAAFGNKAFEIYQAKQAEKATPIQSLMDAAHAWKIPVEET